MFRRLFLTNNMNSMIKKMEEKALEKPISLGITYLCGVSIVSLITMADIDKNEVNNAYYESIVFVAC